MILTVKMKLDEIWNAKDGIGRDLKVWGEIENFKTIKIKSKTHVNSQDQKLHYPS